MCDGDCCNLLNRSVSTESVSNPLKRTTTTSLSVICPEAICYLITDLLLVISEVHKAPSPLRSGLDGPRVIAFSVFFFAGSPSWNASPRQTAIALHRPT